MGDLYEDLGRRVAERRHAAKLTQETVAEHANIGASYLAHIEAGRKRPTLDVLGRIASALSVELWQLFTDSRVSLDEKAWRTRERKLATELQRLSAADLDFVLAFVRKLRRP